MYSFRHTVTHRAWPKKAVAFSTRSARLQPQKEAPPTVNGRELSPKEAKAEAAKLALRSLKDMKSLFSSSSEDADQPIDTRYIYESPYEFVQLSLLHQGQVVQELQEKYDQAWSKMNPQERRLGYYIAYGNWGPREKFTNWNTLEAPLDLPFAVPSHIRSTQPAAGDPVHKLEPVNLAETEVRKAQFDTSKTDPVTKTFLYITAFFILFALARDKNTGEAGRPVEYVVEDQYVKWKKEQRERERLQEKEQQRLQAAETNRRRWYYLWLK